MKSRDFCYWLQGFFELSGSPSLDSNQVEAIRNHLNMVFAHEIDPSFGGPEEQDLLNQLHKPSASEGKRPGRSGLMKC